MKKGSGRILEPSERISEALFGLIMVLTFTGSLSVADAGRDDVRAMLIGALGCNTAWGIIDGILYLMGRLTDQGSGVRAWRALRSAASPDAARRVIAAALPPRVAAAMNPEEFESIRQELVRSPEAPRAHLDKGDWLGALYVFLWVFVVTLPVTLPFIFMDNVRNAMRVSNAIAIALLFILRMCLWPRRGVSPVAHGARDGGPGRRPRGPHHRARGMKAR